MGCFEEKINESAYQILCIQETKREHFDIFYLKKFCPRALDKFAFFPSIGASGGLLTIWNSSVFDGSLVHANAYDITVNFQSKLDSKSFHVSNIYGLANSPEKAAFVTWLINFDTSTFHDWLLGGDFNLIRHSDNRNKPGGDISEMFLFNSLIADLDLVEIPFSGTNYTWSNMQIDPFLVKLDWIFTSSTWTLSFPATYVQPLSRPTSDHIPYVVHIGSSVPKAKNFRFENFCPQHPGFPDTVNLHWNSSAFHANAAKNLSVKLKQVRFGLKKWSKSLSNLSKFIHNCN